MLVTAVVFRVVRLDVPLCKLLWTVPVNDGYFYKVYHLVLLGPISLFRTPLPLSPDTIVVCRQLLIP